MEVRSEKPNKPVIGIDQFAAEVQVKGGAEWQALALTPSHFKDAAVEPLTDWEGIKELRYADQETLRDNKTKQNRKIGAAWEGRAPAFRNLRWQQ